MRKFVKGSGFTRLIGKEQDSKLPDPVRDSIDLTDQLAK
ncbi:Uncharacterised protein [Mycobacteroides abscessus subsp. bolletii]|nr:Uncharacterised protein [Mycobacteroides abscessus subsp. bolletii]SKF66399.1 Uncharacterised protein [Mycobacteroides abscessus subsp. bolletii]SKG30899.1 Uncharacterised protein [Mycobacteroides abscessus subsp. bolletii]SKG48916.1 Uncharacterised protein [Mycobacteroides abscessus subsp. bolletii]SKG63822.1 Uncharacterised protein [Mycobacteroides abscessus subsp. bolletii]